MDNDVKLNDDINVEFTLSSHLDDGSINPILTLHEEVYDEISLPFKVTYQANVYAGITRLSDDVPPNYDGSNNAKSIEFESLIDESTPLCSYVI